MKKKIIFIAMSGGVDSSVAAFLLKKTHDDVRGVFMRNWDSEINESNYKNSKSKCESRQDYEIVEKICKKINIPLISYNFVPEYWENVFQPFLNSFKKNHLNNPDILCNSKIKFGCLIESLKNDYGNNFYLATGHYASIVKKDGDFYLGVCKNKKKDQTYFLSRIKNQFLKKIIFPLSDFEDKKEVRDIAKKNFLINWNKKDSSGICFIGERNFKKFITNYIDVKKGDIVDIENKKVISKHDGVNLYAHHQRKGLNISGMSEKYYVCKKDLKKNILYVCAKKNISKYLYKTESVLSNIWWINEPLLKNEKIKIKTKNTDKFIKAQILEVNIKTIKLKHKNSFITTPGQYVCFYSYDESICHGSGVYLEC